MGIGVEQWRGRIGTFSMPLAKCKFSCPRLVIHVRPPLRLLLCLSLLLVIGGVEPNPGPPKKQTTLSVSGDILVEDDITIKKMFEKLSTQISKSTDELKAEMSCLKEEVQNVNKQYDHIMDRMDSLERENNSLREKLAHTEDQSRRDNLIFWGVKEESDETWEQTEQKVRDIIVNDLKIEDAYDDDKIPIERAHRLGKKTDRERAVIVKFTRWKHKQIVLSAARNIFKKPSTIRVSEDYSQSVRDIRKKLLGEIDSIRIEHEGEKVILAYDKIIAGRRVYRYNNNTDRVYCVSNPREARR